MDRVFDLIIIGFLIGDALVCLALFRFAAHHEPTRWSRRARFFGALGVFSWLVIFYGSFIEPRMMIVNEQTIELSATPTVTLRAALVSDLHLGPYKSKEWAEAAVKKINALGPDVIFLTGDFVYNDTAQIALAEPLKALRAPLGAFAVLGNHDYDDGTPADVQAADRKRVETIQKSLESWGIKILVNEPAFIEKGAKKIALLGADDIFTGHTNLTASLKTAQAAGIMPFDATIALSHNADAVWEAQKLRVDLVLAGHTHGGQIRLPFLGPVPDLPHELGKKYDRGLFAFGRTQLFITSGIGEMGPRARLLVPPEIAFLKMRI